MTFEIGVKDKHKKVDDEPFGGIAGMVMTIQPILDAVNALRSERTYSEIIYLTPDGEPLKQARVNQLSISGNVMMICGHYKGIDERFAPACHYLGIIHWGLCFIGRRIGRCSAHRRYRSDTSWSDWRRTECTD